MEPLKITAHPRCGVITHPNMPIDGILLYAAMAMHYGSQVVTTPGAANKAAGGRFDLPLAVVNEGPQWYYAASFAVWPSAVADGRDYWNKRADQQYTDIVDFGRRRGVINNAAGDYKSYHMPVYYRHALEVSWYVVGDRDEIRRLLATMTHIGKKSSQGWGRVNEWRVEPWGEDWSTWRDGRLMRAIPDAAGQRHGYRPPYWLPENQARCRLP